jgi:hypothetical protein
MYTNPALMEELARDRAASRRQRSDAAALERRVPSQSRAIRSARSAAGWLLVDFGLRLAAPRGATQQPASGRPC